MSCFVMPPQQVLPSLSKHILVDGFHVVIDLEHSHGSWIRDAVTGREILTYYAKLSGLPKKSRAARVEELLSWVDLSHAADTRLRGYSKGMLQRIGVAQALIHDPSVVFLDEPMSGLDPIGRKDVRNLILRLRSEGKTVLINSHILEDVEMICDRVGIIVEGVVRYEGPVEGFIGRGQGATDVVLAGVSAHLGEMLGERFDAKLRGLGDRIELKISEKQVSELLAEAIAQGAEIISVSAHQQSLESLFISTLEKRDAWKSRGSKASERGEIPV